MLQFWGVLGCFGRFSLCDLCVVFSHRDIGMAQQRLCGFWSECFPNHGPRQVPQLVRGPMLYTSTLGRALKGLAITMGVEAIAWLLFLVVTL